jgi:hypothetical protein
MKPRIYLQKEPEDFGQILAALALDIKKRETRLNEIRLRERRATLLVTLYTLAGWGAYLGLWYAQVLPQVSRHRNNSPVDKAIKAFPAILGPVMYVILSLLDPPAYMASRILFTRRIVQLWYNRKGNVEGQSDLATPKPRVHFDFVHVFSEKSLAALKLARRKKVEEIKKKTNYNETRDLLERYEDGPSDRLRMSPSPAWPRNGPVARVQPQQPPSTPQRAVPAVPPNTPANPPAPISPGLQSELVARTSQRALTFTHLTCARRDPAAASPASTQAMVRQARRCTSRGRRVARERRSIALRPHLPKMFHAQRACEGGHVGRRSYVAIQAYLFSLRVDGRH